MATERVEDRRRFITPTSLRGAARFGLGALLLAFTAGLIVENQTGAISKIGRATEEALSTIKLANDRSWYDFRIWVSNTTYDISQWADPGPDRP